MPLSTKHAMFQLTLRTLDNEITKPTFVGSSHHI